MGLCASAPEHVLSHADLGDHAHVKKIEGDIRAVYDFKRVLGDGVEGDVWMAQRGEKKYAIKSISKFKSKEQLDDVVHEVEMLNILGRHPGIVYVDEVWEDKSRIYVVQEYCSGGTLLDFMERHKDHITQQRIAEILRQLIDAIAHCHARGVIHRDIKQENIMFSTRSADSPVKIIDFGNSLFLGKGKTTEGYAGTTFNAAPEIERGERYDHKADIFSLGVMSYLLISGGYPFGYSEQGYQKLLNGEYYKCKNPPFCDNSAKLISKMITANPKTRLTAAKCRSQAFLKLDADHPSSKQAILARHKELTKTTNDKSKRLEVQNRLVESLKSAEEQEDLLDNIVALEAWMIDFQAETKSFSKSFTKSLTKSLTKSASSLTDGLELSAPTITTIENFYLDLQSNGFNMLAEKVHEALKDDLEYTINLDEVLNQLRDDLEGIDDGPASPRKSPAAGEGGKPMQPGEMPPHLVVIEDAKPAEPGQMPAHLVIVED
mmetsp:Transcript_35/g.82  ORF Transcript_35/g.82 Transcript_35/m.82 type:complete len:490 (-) Transcript_35:935-2404(-)